MRYKNIIFDYGGTLGWLDDDQGRYLKIPGELVRLVKRLYDKGYRLGIISNSSRYGDGMWLRSRLQEYDLLRYFEVVVLTSVVGVHKPDPDVFQRVVHLMGIDPAETLMVGDSPSADGGSVAVGIDYFEVSLKEGIWADRLREKLRAKKTIPLL